MGGTRSSGGTSPSTRAGGAPTGAGTSGGDLVGNPGSLAPTLSFQGENLDITFSEVMRTGRGGLVQRQLIDGEAGNFRISGSITKTPGEAAGWGIRAWDAGGEESSGQTYSISPKGRPTDIRSIETYRTIRSVLDGLRNGRLPDRNFFDVTVAEINP